MVLYLRKYALQDMIESGRSRTIIEQPSKAVGHGLYAMDVIYQQDGVIFRLPHELLYDSYMFCYE